MKHVKLLFFLFAFLSACTQNTEYSKTAHQWVVSAPAGDKYCQIDFDGETVLPNSRIITPYGKTVRVAPHPYGLCLSTDGNIAITANSGTSPLSISILKNIQSENPDILQIPEGAKTDKGILASVFMGLAISPDNSLVYVAGGQANKVYIFDIANGEAKGAIDCSYQEEDNDYSHGYIGDMTMTKDGKILYAVDQINFIVLKIDLEKQEVISRTSVGRYPFGICLSPDESKVFVANVGMYAYSSIPGITFENYKEKALKKPPFAFGSEEAIKGTTIDSLEVPGLGDPNAPESFSVWEMDASSGAVTAKVKTGHLVGEMLEDFPAVGGASPNSLVASDQFVFVSNGNNDCISMIDYVQDSVAHEIYLKPDDRLAKFRGVIPFGIDLSPDQQRLYVAESGINAVAVIDVASKEAIGHIPTGWFPSKLKVTPDGKKLIVANAKGYGSGSNGGSTFDKGPEGNYIGNLMKGSVSVINIPNEAELKSLTRQVIANNFKIEAITPEMKQARLKNPVPLLPQLTESPIKHIIFVSKENRTYDEIFGQLDKGKGEAALARYGKNASFSNRDSTSILKDITVMPNHLALAERFAIADNFYVNADHSADGHRWLVNTYPNEWVETSVTATYGGNRNMELDSKAPGALAFDGASGAIYPEDYNEAGSIWEHMERNKIDFWNFGFGTMFAPHLGNVVELKETGYVYAINYPVPAPMFDKTSTKYPTYNMAIPDQFRIDRFIEEFEEKWLNGKDTMPQVLTLIIGNDHGAGERPEAGYPFRESYMADNDLALGRLVEFVSQTPYWKNTAIVVTEDDSQGGVDHVDAHRSILMVISPYAKKNYIGHQHYSFGSIFKTFWNILGTPYLNQYDAGATDLSDLFENQADFAPYKAVGVDKRMFDPKIAYDPLDEQFDWSALEEGPALDDPIYLVQDQRTN